MLFSRIPDCRLIIIFVLFIVVIGKASRIDRIVGGSRAKIEEFPWQVALLENNNFTCGAAIAGKRHILTAAHCVYLNFTKILPNAVSIIAGSAELDDENSRKYDVKFIEIHPGFKEVYPFLHDIAILTLTREIKFDRRTNFIQLPKTNVPVNAIVTFSGWGLSVFGKFTNHLEKLKFTIMNNSYCDEIKINTNHYHYEHPMFKRPLFFGQVCGLPARYSGACEGDSGGALVYKKSLAGIFSWKYGCGKGYPNVFTRVYEYVDWIRKTMAKDKSTIHGALKHKRNKQITFLEE